MCPQVEALHWQEEATEMFVGSESRGFGVLSVTERYFFFITSLKPSSKVVWWNGERGLALEYPSIIIHAISRSPDTFAKPCIYCQMHFGDEDRDNEAPVEIIFAPTNSASCTFFVMLRNSLVESIFGAISRCQALHPDPNSSDEDQMDENSGDEELNEEGLNAHGQVRGVCSDCFCTWSLL